jgi:hypothetical protein
MSGDAWKKTACVLLRDPPRHAEDPRIPAFYIARHIEAEGGEG